MSANRELLGSKPLAGLSIAERRKICHGMDTFEFRGDVDVEDACNSALRITRAVAATLDLMSTSGDIPDNFRHVTEGTAVLTHLAYSCLGLIQAALYDLPPAEQP